MAVSRNGTWSSGIATTLTHVNPAGSNRIMIVAFCGEATSTLDITSVDYGGQALTPGPEVVVGTTVFLRGEIWYLLEQGIRDATNTTITPTWSVAPSAEVTAAGTYDGVDQTTPVPEENFDTTDTTTPNPLTGADIVESNGNAVVAAGGNGLDVQTAMWNAPMSEQINLTSLSNVLTVADRLSVTGANVDIEPTWTDQNRTTLVSIELAAALVDVFIPAGGDMGIS